ncbi:hypothetical protein PORY_002328 [Pneumocystis oryctolagi]|uniref:Uncharacterized protein n=1 Tax=Pneumocystis oryctolagi TaxID=42067 RepID=A0ACB7CBN4_9ASCO|nr:hypothetical protein PORY_002328 [Pneumocystis oryctolagi]
MFFWKCLERKSLSVIFLDFRFFRRNKSVFSWKKRSKNSFLQNIRVLEQYVVELRKKLEKDKNQRIFECSNFDQKSSKNEYVSLYKSICDLQNQEFSLEVKKPAIPSFFSKKFESSFQELSSDTTWGQKLNIINSYGGFSGLTVSEVNELIVAISSEERGRLAEVILNMIKDASIPPNRLTYELIMDGYAEIGNAERAMHLFSQMKQCGIIPSVFSYAHLMKACLKANSANDALLVFKDMKKNSIEPNLTVYTTLISALIRKRLFNNAWDVFDLLKYRSKDVSPDVKTYSLMIHACSLTGEAERANNLFEEMSLHSDGPLTPTLGTYNALIHAFVARKDYFYEAWRIAKMMMDNNILMDINTLNALLKGCGKAGDLKKARILAKFIFQKYDCLDNVDVHTFQGLLRAYSNYIPNNHTLISKKVDCVNNKHDADILISKLDTGISENINNGFFQDIKNFVFFKEELSTSGDVLKESKALIAYMQKNKYPFLDVQLMNTYLSVLINHKSYLMFRHVYENMYYSITIENQEKSINLHSNKYKRGPYAYQLALDAAYKFNDLDFARSVWNERKYWRYLIENERKKSKKISEEFTQEYLNELDFSVYKLMINILTKNNLLKEVQDLLVSSKNLFPWKIDHLKPLWRKVGQIKDDALKSLILEITGLRKG